MKWRAGFTLPELIVVMGVVAILFGIGSQSLIGSQHRVSVTSSVSQLIADIKLQQSKAMWGDTEGRPTTDNYGIHFESDKYTLFHGTYSVSETSNFVVPVDVQLSSTFPTDLIFAKGSGEIIGYDPSADTITVSSSTDSKTIEFNQYGVITNNQ